MEAAEEKVLTTQDSISNTYSYDGYEILHDEAMDKISVSIHYSDYEEAFEGKSQNNLVKPKESEEKKMKISLSQDQLKLNPSVCNFLSVPKTTRKSQSSSFFFSEKPNENDLMKSLLKPEAFESSTVRRNPILNHNKIFLPPSTFPKVDVDNDEIVYATPRRSQVIVENEIKVSSASSAPTVVQTCSTADFSENSIFPSSFYCKICNNVLSDPRTLDCLHTFCMQCLARLDASNDLQNNQFWRKISEEHSDASFQFASLSSVDSDLAQKGKFSFTGSLKSKKLSKDKSPTRSVKGRHSSIISFSEKPKSIICPTCGLTTEMTIHGVFRLPQNTLITRKIRDKTGNVREKPDTCHLCPFNVAATTSCVTCNYKLCSNCKDIHKRHTSNHEFKKLEKQVKKRFDKSSARDTSIKCLVHLNSDLKLFCTACCQMICSECTLLIHRGHKMTSVSKAAKIYIETLKEAKDNTKPLSTYAIHSISKLNDISKKINSKCDMVEHDVETFLADYFEALEVHKRTLLHQISRCRETKMDMIQCQQMDLERRSNEAKTAIAFTETLLRDGTEEENLMLVSLLLKKFDSCSDRAIDVKITDSLQFLPSVKAPSNQAQNNIPLFGIITTQIAVARNCTLETMSGLMNLRVNKKAELTIQTRDIEDRAMCHGSAEVDVTVSYREVAFKTLPVNVSDKRDGTYIISFIPESPGALEIKIFVNCKPIRDSPFTVRARNLRPHLGIFHCCSFCSSNGKKVCACGGEMPIDGYVGCGHGHSGWAGRRHWSCCASTMENSECSVANAISSENLPE